ncbi:MAG: hypothetical protein ACM3JK_06410 [Betaproteobacteria bacterium]
MDMGFGGKSDVEAAGGRVELSGKNTGRAIFETASMQSGEQRVVRMEAGR